VAQPEAERQPQQTQIGPAAGPLARTHLERSAGLVAPDHHTVGARVCGAGHRGFERARHDGKGETGRRIADIGFREFCRQLKYKARLYGAELVTASRWFPNSKMCAECGVLVEELPLSLREWRCACGALHDRDTNAARNLCRYTLDRASCARINACGEEGSGAGLRTSVKPASTK